MIELHDITLTAQMRVGGSDVTRTVRLNPRRITRESANGFILMVNRARDTAVAWRNDDDDEYEDAVRRLMSID